jgi:hypothetical protein
MAMSFHSSAFALAHMNLNAHVAKIDLQKRDINIYQPSGDNQHSPSGLPAGGATATSCNDYNEIPG